MMDPQLLIVLLIGAGALGYLVRQARRKLAGDDDGGSCPGCRKCAASRRELPVLK
jgi:hypothetical protein